MAGTGDGPPEADMHPIEFLIEPPRPWRLSALQRLAPDRFPTERKSNPIGPAALRRTHEVYWWLHHLETTMDMLAPIWGAAGDRSGRMIRLVGPDGSSAPEAGDLRPRTALSVVRAPSPRPLAAREDEIVSEWDAGRAEFLRLVGQAGLDEPEAARLDTQMRGILRAARSVARQIDVEQPDEPAVGAFRQWREVLCRLVEIEQVAAALLESRSQPPAGPGGAEAGDRTGGAAVTGGATGCGGPPSPPGGEPRQPLPPCHERALRQYQHALATSAATDRQLGDKPTDKQVFDWLGRRETGEGVGTLGSFKCWSRYLRAARRHHGLNKHTPRHGRATGGSVVDRNEV
jgi:hypothetical protein